MLSSCIKAEDQKQLFQPFVQLDSTLTRRFAGTGLGLALVKQIAEMHEGSVSVHSQLGVGSDFAIHLPWSLPLPEKDLSKTTIPDLSLMPSQLLDEKSASSDGALVLIADDDEDNIETVWDYLLGRGYRLIRAVNGQEAVFLTESHQPDLILMDIQMPTLNGLDAIAIIRKQPNTAQTPIIALTALAMERDRQRCLEAGANFYLTKPFRLKTLVEHMQSLLNNP